MYKEYKSLNLPEIDKNILEFWEKEHVFEKSISERPASKPFVFYEGPPSANGMPGIHHVMGRAIKDIFCRFHSMKGKRVERKGGWDTHGLPIELSVEKELGITKDDIGTKISIDEYNQKCRETVMRYKDRWDALTRKMGYWVDLENPYITFENEYMESVWHILKRLYDRKLLYKGYTIQPFSPAAGTGLSTHELNMPGAYKDIRDTSITAQFKISEPEKLPFKTDQPTYFLAWTTTPWTLPSNCALVVGGKIEYAAVESLNPYTFERGVFILAKALIGKNFNPKGENVPIENFKTGEKIIPYKILATFKGTDIEGIHYEQLMPYVAPNGDKAFLVLLGDFVTTEDGTGMVHTAALFGADDFKVTKATGTAFITVKDELGNDVPLVNKKGLFVKEVTDFALEPVKEQYLTAEQKEISRQKLGLEKYLSVDERISIKLKKENKAFKVEKYNHNYPHCWRTDKPILYYPLDSWFIKASQEREKMYALNQQINWKPASTGTGRFGNWLQNLQDWNLSRSRYWGIPLPIWRTKDTTSEKCIGSIAELQMEIDKANAAFGLQQTVPNDLHRPYIDNIILVSDAGEEMTRELDLIDVWFDSGAMPYAQWHYPFENKEKFKKNYPADFIAEGVDQTRGWFYTLHAIAAMAFDSIAFKNVVSNGLVLDKNGQKMSKRLGNAVEPFETLEKYGADAVRWYMISNAQPWDNLKFDLEGIEEVRRKFFGTLYNTYSFFVLYANVDGFTHRERAIPLAKRPEIDQWVLSLLNSLIEDVNKDYADYEPTNATRRIQNFVDEHLSNWYVRLSRRRFWKSEGKTDKIAAYQTLYECLTTIAKLMSPVAPFFGDWLYQNLNNTTQKEKHISVHLADFPKVKKGTINKELEQRMNYAQRISSLILSLRKEQRIRVRQPLSRVLLPIIDVAFQPQVEAVKNLILAETNIKKIEYITDTTGFVTKKIKANFKTLGARLGKNMKAVSAFIETLTQQDIALIEKNKTFSLNIEGVTYNLTLEDIVLTSEDIPGWLVASDNDITVALDISLSEDLLAEGMARELVNRIQNIRKDRNFNVTDKIHVTFEPHPSILAAVDGYKSYICAETLATKLSVEARIEGEQVELLEGVVISILVESDK
jgi:isoleucyl-tRNA synthetase